MLRKETFRSQPARAGTKKNLLPYGGSQSAARAGRRLWSAGTKYGGKILAQYGRISSARYCWFLLFLILGMGLGGCAQGGQASVITPSPTPETLTIEINGETVVFQRGVNILPEHYALAQDPEFLANTEWILVDGMWQPIAKGVGIPLDICSQDPTHPDCTGLYPTPTALPGLPEMGWIFTDPAGRFTFPYPTGWYTMTLTPDPSDGVRVLDAPSLQESARWISLQVFPNTQRASLQVWIAEHGVGWPGEVTEQEEGLVNGVPVLRQRLVNDDPNMGGPYVYALLWYPYGDWILCWTGWPGEQAETLNLLEQMVSGFRRP